MQMRVAYRVGMPCMCPLFTIPPTVVRRNLRRGFGSINQSGSGIGRRQPFISQRDVFGDPLDIMCAQEVSQQSPCAFGIDVRCLPPRAITSSMFTMRGTMLKLIRPDGLGKCNWLLETNIRLARLGVTRIWG
jgi:hypothetical protein